MKGKNGADDFLDGINTPEEAAERFRMKFDKFLDYLKYIEELPEHKRTIRMKELIAKFGSNPKH